MIVKIKTCAGSKKISDIINIVLKEYEEEGLTISGVTAYVNFHDEDGSPVDVVDSRTGESKERLFIPQDIQEDEICKFLMNGMSNKDVATVLNINIKRVSATKNRLQMLGQEFPKVTKKTRQKAIEQFNLENENSSEFKGLKVFFNDEFDYGQIKIPFIAPEWVKEQMELIGYLEEGDTRRKVVSIENLINKKGLKLFYRNNLFYPYVTKTIANKLSENFDEEKVVGLYHDGINLFELYDVTNLSVKYESEIMNMKELPKGFEVGSKLKELTKGMINCYEVGYAIDSGVPSFLGHGLAYGEIEKVYDFEKIITDNNLRKISRDEYIKNRCVTLFKTNDLQMIPKGYGIKEKKELIGFDENCRLVYYINLKSLFPKLSNQEVDIGNDIILEMKHLKIFAELLKKYKKENIIEFPPSGLDDSGKLVYKNLSKDFRDKVIEHLARYHKDFYKEIYTS